MQGGHDGRVRTDLQNGVFATVCSYLSAFCLTFVVGGMFSVGNVQAQTSATGEEQSAVDLTSRITVMDKPWDSGDTLLVTLYLTEEQITELQKEDATATISLMKSEELGGLYTQTGSYPPNDGNWAWNSKNQTITREVAGLVVGHPYYFRAYWVPEEGEQELIAESQMPGRTVENWFVGEKATLAWVGLLICGSVIMFIEMARRGMPLKVRKIAGLEAVDEAVGRATEMGRSVLFVPGIQDMNEIQTIAGLNILSHVAQTAAEFDADVEVPTSRALVMTAARETLQGAYLMAGRPDNYNPDLAYYVTDEQFGYVAYVSGMMVREKPAACFYLGSFFAESLILAETGN